MTRVQVRFKGSEGVEAGRSAGVNHKGHAYWAQELELSVFGNEQSSGDMVRFAFRVITWKLVGEWDGGGKPGRAASRYEHVSE